MAWFMVFVFGWSLLATSIAVSDDMDPGNVKLTGCTDYLIDLREKANNTITCEGFNQNANIVWLLERNGKETPVATCNADFKCVAQQPGYVDVQRSLSQSKLLYQQNDREVDITTNIECRSQLQTKKSYEKCTFNVIKPATLHQCAVGVAAENGAVRGECRFEGAFSSNRSFTCMWYLDDSEQIRVPGNISYTRGSNGQSGKCTFLKKDLSMDLANYTYSILFYPGPGKMNVTFHNVELRTKSTSGETASTSTKVTTTQTSTSFPATIVGVSVGVLVLVIVIVVVVAVVIIKKRKDTTYEKPRRRRNAEEEHVYADLQNTPTMSTPSPQTNNSPESATSLN